MPVSNPFLSSAFWSAVAAGLSCVVAYLQLKHNRRADAHDHRPWLGIAEASTVTVEAGKPLTFHLRTENYGKTPALAVHLKLNIASLDRIGDESSDSFDSRAAVRLEKKWPDLQKQHARSFGPVAPTSVIRHTVEIGDAILAPQQIALMQQGKLRFYVYGEFTYSAVSKPDPPYKTIFCHRIGKEIGRIDDTGFTMHMATAWNDMS